MQHNRHKIFLALGNNNKQKAPFQDERKSDGTPVGRNGTLDVQNLNTHTEDRHQIDTSRRIFTNKHKAMFLNPSEKHTRHRVSTNTIMVLPKHIVMTAKEKSKAQASKTTLSCCTTNHYLDVHGVSAKRLNPNTGQQSSSKPTLC